MKVISAIGITRILVLILGAITLMVGFPAAFDCHSYALYRRKLRHHFGWKTFPIWVELFPSIPSDKFKAYHWRNLMPDSNNLAWIIELICSSAFPLTITPSYLYAVISFGSHLGEPEINTPTRNCWDIFFAFYYSLMASISGGLMITSAIFPDNIKRDKDILPDAHRLGKDIDLWVDYLDEVSGHVTRDAYARVIQAIGIERISPEKFGEAMAKELLPEIMVFHRLASNYTLKLAAAGLCFAYSVALFIQALLMIREVKKARKAIQSKPRLSSNVNAEVLEEGPPPPPSQQRGSGQSTLRSSRQSAINKGSLQPHPLPRNDPKKESVLIIPTDPNLALKRSSSKTQLRSLNK